MKELEMEATIPPLKINLSCSEVYPIVENRTIDLPRYCWYHMSSPYCDKGKRRRTMSAVLVGSCTLW